MTKILKLIKYHMKIHHYIAYPLGRRDEKVGVDHLMKQRLHQILPGAQGEQGLGEPDGAEPAPALVGAHARAPNKKRAIGGDGEVLGNW